MVERWQYLEGLGFDSLWVADHFVNPYVPQQPWYEGWTLLTGLATQTVKIRVGALVTNFALHNPAMLARRALTLDHISGGRLDVGLGSGTPGDVSYAMTGTPDYAAPERVARFREAVEIIDSLLSNGTTTYDGMYYQIKGAEMNPRPLQEPRPPFTIAALGPTMLRIAARYADTWNTYPGPGVEAKDALGVIGERNRMLEDYCAQIDRDPGEISRSLLVYGKTLGVNPFGSVAAFEDLVGRYREAGLNEFVFYYPPQEFYPTVEGDEPDVFERVAREVIPALRKGWGAPGG
jgi:alkanesulfonate monooxygenase SsuD/methylene tetrahydromethanopterin reductase-like flavin-dependent oxidoreductase (luciferase family)